MNECEPSDNTPTFGEGLTNFQSRGGKDWRQWLQDTAHVRPPPRTDGGGLNGREARESVAVATISGDDGHGGGGGGGGGSRGGGRRRNRAHFLRLSLSPLWAMRLEDDEQDEGEDEA